MTEPLAESAWDVLVIGGGPAGLFAAHESARAGQRVLLVEAGDDMRGSLCPRVRAVLRGQRVRDVEKFRLQCTHCTCLVGIGGAAFHFDTNLGYIRGLTRSKVESDGGGGTRTYSGLERALGSFAAAQSGIEEVYETFYRLGLPRAGGDQPADTETIGDHQADTGAVDAVGAAFALADTAPSQPITVDEALGVVEAMLAEIRAERGLVLTGHRASGIRRTGRGFAATVAGPSGGEFHARSVIVAVGKLGLPWVRGHLDDLAVRYDSPRRVDLGVRLETSAEDAAPLTAACHNPKFTYLNDAGEPVRTFCVCERGRIMQYQFLDTVVLDGQHCLTTPTARTNLGIITTVDVPRGRDGTDFALDFARRVNKAGTGGSVVQSVGEFLGRPPSGSGPTVTSSLLEAARGDLAGALGPARTADVAGMIERLNDASPGLVGPYALLAAPVVERIYPALELSEDMESSVPGLYFVGDSSSKIIGVTYGAVTGIRAARSAMGRSGAC
ncbi:NAD(P)/FAD-dependent oxidoreductase [Catenulispora sp. NL8]|uniref:NAD(P)/FAD-dependent oxidoreductase n=1 Tax=Catenulispora pinistramenti TaxID=2705254 RepID=A0ABS5KRA9_9ACTN|nr:NAD(P)/FAD-dependent oxidoreductase [Catenulispora pinistramenti]MBS2548572.1 NAD(P)/FAD-dependent oxidoreductase [Catenulispora pinistramenti]